MTCHDSPQTADNSPRPTPLDLPRILPTVIAAGLGTLIVVGFFLGPQLDEGSEEARHKWFSRLCRQAQSELSALPPDQRLIGHEVLGRVSPNLVIVGMPETEERSRDVRAALTEPDYQIARIFIPRAINAPLTDGRDDYTIENAEVYLAHMKIHRRRQWITFLSVWLATWVFLSWRLLLQAHLQAMKTIP